MSWNNSDPATWKRLAPVLVVLLIGAGLRSVQYFAQVGLWADEIAVARNVEAHGTSQLLTEPQGHDQVASGASWRSSRHLPLESPRPLRGPPGPGHPVFG